MSEKSEITEIEENSDDDEGLEGINLKITEELNDDDSKKQ